MGFMGHFEPNMGQNMGFMGNMGNICSVGSLYVKTMLFTIGIATRCTMLSIYFVVKISRKSVIQLP